MSPALPRRALRDLPTLKGDPLLGNLRDARRDPILLFERLARLGGDLAALRFGPYGYLVLQGPDAVRHVLVENARAYQKSPSYRGLRMILGNGLITSEGEFWKRQRKLAQPAFHRERLGALADAMVSDTADMLAQWRREGDRGFDLHDAMMHLTLRIVGHALFSTDVQGDAGAVGAAFAVAIERANEEAVSLVHLPTWLPLPGNARFHGAMKTLDALVHRIIGERRAMPEEKHPRDLLSMLMSARDDEGAGMSDAQLRDEVMSIVGAGHETTANALAWTFHVLGDHPEAAARVAAEAQAAFGERTPTMDDCRALPYTKRVVEEAMRLYPPVWGLERIAIEDDVVGDVRVPKGTLVGVIPWCIHRDPRWWPDPERFDPDRFLPAAVEARPRYAYLPFGAGPRVCIGNSFALMEAQLALAMIAREYRLERAPWHRAVLDASVTLRPKGGMPMVRRRREAAGAALDRPLPA
ncbi:MAG: cytochrome P450 [Deltaproteobacteria bacterium]|nr:cytochrome P450 [Myxococcales bacterium]MDP3212478.1 cytochrome P450 [Deltaproteobacteria bacterium]